MSIEEEYKKAIDFIYETFEPFRGEPSETFKELEDGRIQLEFPYSEYYDEIPIYSKDEIIQTIQEFKTCSYGEYKYRLKTSTGIFYPFSPKDLSSEFFIPFDFIFETQNEFIKIKTTESKRLLMAFISVHLGYFGDYYDPMEVFPRVLDLEYVNTNQEQNIELELQLLRSLQFEIVSQYGILLEPKEIVPLQVFNEEPDEFDVDDFEESIGKRKVLNLGKLPKYEFGLKMFTTAEKISDPEFKYLSFYKTIEHYAPVALRIDVFEQLVKKLDSPKVKKPDNKYLESLLELATSYELRKKDSEYAKTVLRNCIDILDMVDEFPNFIKSKVTGLDVSYSAKKGERDKLINTVALVLYSTRNELAHAKSNFKPTEMECPLDELEALNLFMRSLVLRVIKWYSRLPEHQKLSST